MDDKLQSQVVGEVNASFLSSQITSLRNTALPFTYNIPVVLYVLVRTSMYSILVHPHCGTVLRTTCYYIMHIRTHWERLRRSYITLCSALVLSEKCLAQRGTWISFSKTSVSPFSFLNLGRSTQSAKTSTNSGFCRVRTGTRFREKAK